MPCVVGPDPEPDESLSGFVLRLAEANGYDRPSGLFGIPQGTTTNLNGRYISKSIAEAVAGLAGLDPDSLVSRAYTGCSERAGRATFYGVELSSSQISAARPKLCPDCLLGRPILQAAWDLALWVVCPHQGCYLINRCQFCGSPIEWEISGVALCHHCGSPLTSVSGGTAEEPAVELSLQMATLVPVLPREMRRSKFAERLRDLNIRSLVDLVKFVGSAPRAKRLSRRKVTPTQARSVFKNAAEVLDTWPEGYHRFVKQWELFDPAALKLVLAQEFSDPALHYSVQEQRPMSALLFKDAYLRISMRERSPRASASSAVLSMRGEGVPRAYCRLLESGRNLGRGAGRGVQGVGRNATHECAPF